MALTYTTYADIRTACGVNSTVLPDADAEALGQLAEDVIDEQLGNWAVDEETGRKVAEVDVDEWQWDKLGRATTVTAKYLFDHPEFLTEQRFSSQGGDISSSGLVGSAIPGLSIILNATGLRNLTGRMA